jgi:hypothetical protein
MSARWIVLLCLVAGCVTSRTTADQNGTRQPFHTVLVRLDIPNASIRSSVEHSIRAAYHSRSPTDSTVFVAAIDYDTLKSTSAGPTIDALLVLAPIGAVTINTPRIDHTAAAECPIGHAGAGQCLEIATTDHSGVLLFNNCCQLTATMHDLRATPRTPGPHVVWSTTIDAGILTYGTPTAADPISVFSDIAAATVRALQHERLVN